MGGRPGGGPGGCSGGWPGGWPGWWPGGWPGERVLKLKLMLTQPPTKVGVGAGAELGKI